MFHGGGGSPQEYMGQWESADSRNFILVLAQTNVAVTNDAVWNGGGCCDPAWRDNPQYQDVQYFEDVASQLIANFNTDASRIYVHGGSNGAILVHRLACESSYVAKASDLVGGMAWKQLYTGVAMTTEEIANNAQVECGSGAGNFDTSICPYEHWTQMPEWYSSKRGDK